MFTERCRSEQIAGTLTKDAIAQDAKGHGKVECYSQQLLHFFVALSNWRQSITPCPQPDKHQDGY